jgi:mRNA deadenylase 3'-5' endonuclease subunit Ccr4
MPEPFRLVTWNVLATAYIRRSYYPATPAQVLDPLKRIQALVRRAVELNADILCLQEVEQPTFEAMQSALSAKGYAGLLAMKGKRRPDGCATFYREDGFELARQQRLEYGDGTGHIAQVLAFRRGHLTIDIVNTHLKWDAPAAERDQQFGYRQAAEALVGLNERRNDGVQVICGDFNVTPDSALVDLLTSAGFRSVHQSGFSCNSNGSAKLIDYILFRGPVQASGEPLARIDGRTPLPSASEPSDHLPLVARFDPERTD